MTGVQTCALPICYDDFTTCLKAEGLIYLKHGIELPSANNKKTYSATATQADAFAENVTIDNGSYVFDFKSGQTAINGFRLDCPGLHNVENAVAAILVGIEMGLSVEELKAGIGSFKGVKRRFEYVLKNEKMVLIDDYAHHPTELKAAITTVRELYPGKKILGIFQPHLYSRTRDFVDGFAESLSLLDSLILLEIYPARELPIPGVTSSMILDRVNIADKKVCEKSKLTSLIEHTDAEIVVTLGAGDIDALVQPIAALLKNRTEYKKEEI